MLNGYILFHFYLYELSQNTWPLWIYYSNSTYTITSVSLPKHFSLSFWNQKAFSPNSYWLLCAEVAKLHINILSIRHEWHQTQHPGNHTRKSRSNRMFFLKWGRFEKNLKASVLICTHGCITSVLTCIHTLFKLNSASPQKKPRGLDPLGCTD